MLIIVQLVDCVQSVEKFAVVWPLPLAAGGGCGIVLLIASRRAVLRRVSIVLVGVRDVACKS